VALTLIDAVNAAGGLTKDADPHNVTPRQNSRNFTVDMQAFLEPAVSADNPALAHADVGHLDLSYSYLPPYQRPSNSTCCPRPGFDRGDAIAFFNEVVPRLADGFQDGVMAVENPVGEEALAQILPDILLRIEFGGPWRQRHQLDIGDFCRKPGRLSFPVACHPA